MNEGHSSSPPLFVCSFVVPALPTRPLPPSLPPSIPVLDVMFPLCLLSLLSDDVKHAKQLFVSGLTGTTLTEVALLGCLMPVSTPTAAHTQQPHTAARSNLPRPGAAHR